MSDLLAKQQQFAFMVATLIREGINQGYGVTLGEAERTKTQAALNAQAGTGIKASLHIDRLAIDLHLYRAQVYLSDTPSYQPLGEWWEKQGGSWGGRFGDGNHFSLSYQGRK